MKIRRICVLFMLFALALSFAAFADVAYEPYNDDFYEKHRDECEYENRVWIVNGSDGHVVGCTSPTGSASQVFPNGREYYVSYTWDDGSTVWGCIEYDPASLESAWRDAESAWVDMSSMVPRYDSEAFMDDHAAQLQDTERIMKVGLDDKIIAYRYPGSGIVTDTLENWGGDVGQSLVLGSIYTDAEGREWGRVGYYYGIRDVWVCISEPFAELPAGAEYTEREIIPASDEPAMDAALREASGMGGYALAGALGVAVIAAAVIAYIVIRKRKGA